MRIIAGQYRSRPIRSLRGMDTRPTSDRLRETLFDILTAGNPQALAGTVWLDLFAGTGAVGLEALSRGARQVYFVEPAKPTAQVIRDNLRTLQVAAGFELVERDAVQALRLLDTRTVTCDFCFLDPPYGMTKAYEEALGFLSQSRLLRPSAGTVIAEHDKRFDPGARHGALERFRLLQQGDAALSFYRLGEAPACQSNLYRSAAPVRESG
jgi:16S rRNA (guanine(966)-N(2))-methyltransferase RsmD